jgi:hypothetical protein
MADGATTCVFRDENGDDKGQYQMYNPPSVNDIISFGDDGDDYKVTRRLFDVADARIRFTVIAAHLA